MLDELRRRNHWLPLGTFVIGSACAWYASSRSVVVFICIVLLTLFFTYLELMAQWSFRAPPRRRPPIEDDAWNPMHVNVGSHRLVMYHQAQSNDAPTVIMGHGWTAGAIRMTHRAESFLERGWNVVMMDFPNHGGSTNLPKWSAEQTCTLAMQALNFLAEQKPSLFRNKIVYFGHSMGAFVGLRCSKRRDELKFGDNIAAWIFESPMTGYTDIFEETCHLLLVPPPIRGLLLRKSIRHFNAMNKHVHKLTSLEEADTPAWGLPSEPTLLVQAYPDERLGDLHHQRLTNAMESAGRSDLLTVHLLGELDHSGANSNSARKAVIDRWIDANFDYSSSD